MPAPLRAELQRALLEIRQAAEGLKSYEAERAEALQAAISAHLTGLAATQGLSDDSIDRCERIVQQANAVLGSVERARRYPSQIMARADVLDRAGMLGKMIRDLEATIARPGR